MRNLPDKYMILYTKSDPHLFTNPKRQIHCKVKMVRTMLTSYYKSRKQKSPKRKPNIFLLVLALLTFNITHNLPIIVKT